MSYQEQLYNTYYTSKRNMFDARDKEARAYWMNMFRWASQEIRRNAAGTVVSA